MIYIIQNDPDVPPGQLTEELDILGQLWTVVHPYRGEALPPVPDMAALIVMGGAMCANDDATHPFLGAVKAAIKEVTAKEIPFMGICLGGQMLAAIAGGTVTAGAYGEKGIVPLTLTEEGLNDALFNDIADPLITFQWHDDSFSIPPAGVRLAYSEVCPNQAFRIGPCAWGLQFHPEVNEQIVREWSSWTEETASQTDQFVAAFREQQLFYREVIRRLMINFSGLISKPH